MRLSAVQGTWSWPFLNLQLTKNSRQIHIHMDLEFSVAKHAQGQVLVPALEEEWRPGSTNYN